MRVGDRCVRPRGILTSSLRSRENAASLWTSRSRFTKLFESSLSRSCCEVDCDHLIADDQEDFPQRRKGAKQRVELVACRFHLRFLFTSLFLLPSAFRLLCTRTVRTLANPSRFASSFARAFAFTHTTAKSASMGRGDVVSRTAIGSPPF